MTAMLNIGKSSADLIRKMGIPVKYYESRLSSNVASHQGAFDYDDGSTLGFYYKDPIVYNVLRTGIDFKKITEKAGDILQGGCTLTIPKKQKDHHAIVTSPEPITTLDLSTNANLTVTIDSGTPLTIDCSQNAEDSNAVTLKEIIRTINDAGLGEIAYESDKDGDPLGEGYLSLKSLTIRDTSQIDIVESTSNDIMETLFGLKTNTAPHSYTPSKVNEQFMDVFHKVSRGDVFVVHGRHRREGEILKKGEKDSVSAFDIKKIVSVSKGITIYKEGIDYTLDSKTILWTATGSHPEDGENYTVEYLCEPNYIVYDELAGDRGRDEDEIPKRVHLALRQYANTETIPID